MIKFIIKYLILERNSLDKNYCQHYKAFCEKGFFILKLYFKFKLFKSCNKFLKLRHKFIFNLKNVEFIIINACTYNEIIFWSERKLRISRTQTCSNLCKFTCSNCSVKPYFFMLSSAKISLQNKQSMNSYVNPVGEDEQSNNGINKNNKRKKYSPSFKCVQQGEKWKFFEWKI